MLNIFIFGALSSFFTLHNKQYTTAGMYITVQYSTGAYETSWAEERWRNFITCTNSCEKRQEEYEAVHLSGSTV